MAGFGDVLRGLGSVLNPAVMQDVNKDKAAEQAQSAQMQQFALGQLVKGVESGAISPDALPPQLRGMVAPSPEAQAKMQALKNEKEYRDAFAGLGPNPTEDQMAQLAAKHGKPEVAAAYAKAKEDRALRIQSAADNLDLKHKALEQQKDLALQRASDKKDQDAILNSFREQSLAIQQQNAGLSAEMRKMGLELKRDAQNQKADQASDSQALKLSAALEKAGLNEAHSVLGAVEQALGKNKDLASYLTGPKSLLPDMAVPNDVAAGRQAFQKLFNITLKNRSGAAVTIPEFERLKAEFGNGTFKTPEMLQNAVTQARNIIDRHALSIGAGFGKVAVDKLNSNADEIGAPKLINSKEDPLGIRK